MVEAGRQPTTLRRRMLAALTVLVASLALTAALAHAAHRDGDKALDEVMAAEEGIESVLRLAIALRDAYAHQAHVVILNNTSHVHHYGASFDATRRALVEARRRLDGTEHEALDRIERITTDLDRNFRTNIAPLVPGAPAAFAVPHDTALHLLEQGQEVVDGLAERLDARAQTARARAESVHRRAAEQIALVFIGALLLAVMVALFMYRSVAGPLRALETGTRKLGGGELGTRIDVRRDDELGVLARRFNEMAQELEARELRMLEAERLAGVGKVAAGVAHEINNPLSVILGYARLIEKQGGPAAQDAHIILDEVERCRVIVAGLLDLSRAPTLARAPLDLEELTKDVVARTASAGPGLDVAVAVHGVSLVEADEGKVRQIVTNLLVNAREAAPAQQIDVVIDDAGDAVRLSVRDRGAGVAPELRQKLFEPFFTTKAKGTGLGLAVSASLARAHGGSLRLVDDPEIFGARFDLVLPKRAPAEVA